MEIIPLQGEKVVIQCNEYYNVNGLKKVKKKEEKMTNNYTLQPPAPP